MSALLIPLLLVASVPLALAAHLLLHIPALVVTSTRPADRRRLDT